MIEPTLIKNDSPHQVTLVEGSNVAIHKKAEIQEPSVRKVIAGVEGPEQTTSFDSQRLVVSEVDPKNSTVEQPVFQRELEAQRALAPENQDDASNSSPGPVIASVLDDHMALLPEALVVDADRVAGPQLTDANNDHFVKLPETLPETLNSADIRAKLDALEDPVAPPVGTAAAEMAASEMAGLENDTDEMPQMDFPARVVALKIENDKVRSKLDALQLTKRN